MKKIIPGLFAVLFFVSCSTKTTADLLVYNATIYTVDSVFSTAEAMAIKDGMVLATGKTADLENSYDYKEKLDAQGAFIYPGFIDAHAHFVSYGNSLQRVNLVGTKSWEEVVERTHQFATTKLADDTTNWILGRGWDQNDWTDKVFPTNDRLNELFPNRPVLLTRIDGHAAMANQKALELAGIQAGDTLTGGEIDEQEGTLTGLLIDNAIDLVSVKIPASTEAQFSQALKDAEKNCFAAGLTTIDDCGLGYEAVEGIRKLQENGELNMRLFVMLSDEKKNYAWLEKNGIIKTDNLHVRGFKAYADGALGSRGACLLQDYSDRPGWKGFLLSAPSHFDSIASLISQKGWQLSSHAIGDSGNRTLLNVYMKYLAGTNDLRWRIEHAQVVDAADFDFYGKYNIVPSVQPTHATSDMYWAGERLGPDRVKNAYAYKQLMDQNGWIALGTDFPVEDISPLKTFYAAVIRKDASGWPAGGYQVENALTREQTIRGMTIWAARSNFEEKEKGSLETGKWADFVWLDKDLMKADEKELLSIKVLRTYLGGKKVYGH
jgi:predicted amidohydrolase YtcJ